MDRWSCARSVALGVLAGVCGAQSQWVEVPGPRIGLWPLMVHDIARGKNVLFGNGTLVTAALEWNERGWNSSPFGSVYYSVNAAAYDPARRLTVVGTWSGETWEWNGFDWRLASSGTAGPNSLLGATAYDVRRARVVWFGADETWEWDGTRWAQMSPVVEPSFRAWPTLVHDVARERTLLFGGNTGQSDLNELWEYDGTTWLMRTPTVVPPPMSSHVAAYDIRRQRMVVFGGANAETWEWDGARWLRQFPAHVPPLAPAVGTYDVSRGTVIMYQYGGPECGLWEWDGNDWSRHPSASAPVESLGVRTAAFDPDGSVIRFGGQERIRSKSTSDTWRWRDGAWTLLSPRTVPPARASHAMAFDSLRSRIVMFGGGAATSVLADTWEWNGADWIQRSPSQGPSPRWAHAMAYDHANQRTILFGGHDATGPTDETWSWDGSSWTRLAPALRPPARYLHAMAYDSKRQRVLLYGGADRVKKLFTDTWEFDGANWVQVSPAQSPGGIYEHAMTWDSDRQRIVMFGGAPQSAVWEWDGQVWSRRSDWLPAMLGHEIEYESKYQRLLVTGDRTLLYGPVRAGTTTPIGTGCGAVRGFTTNTPRIGTALECELVTSLSGAPCVVGLAASPQTLSLGGGCSLYLKDPSVLWFAGTNAFGVAQPYGVVPTDVSLRGLTLYAQGFVADPQGPVLGMSFTAGRKLVIGD